MRGNKKTLPLPKICHTRLTMMKVGTVIPCPKSIQKIYESSDTLLEFCWYQHFSQEISKFSSVQIWTAFWYIISNSFDLFWIFKDFFNKNGYNLMMWVKMATLGLRKTKLFWNNDYDVIGFVNDVTNKILWSGLNYILEVIMWPKFY